MDAKLSKVGVEHEFITVQAAGHGLTGVKPEEVASAADRAVQFVKAHTT
jgi:dipeptidyl aminopeptidase/acylaminoacyl peptidase